MVFSKIIKELRRERKLTQAGLADALNIPQSTVAKYETGKLEANFSTLCKLADFFGVSVDYLLGREN